MTPDLVLEGGTVVDGTGAPGVVADVGIADGRIAAVGPGLAGRETIDCAGHVVCPGFIDTHSHSDVKVLADPTLPMKVRQGITLEVFGQDGISVAPVREDERAAVEAEAGRPAGRLRRRMGLVRDVRGYLARVAAARAGAGLRLPRPARRHPAGRDGRRRSARPRADELARMQALLREGLARGRLRALHRPHLPALLLRGHRRADRAGPRAGGARGAPSSCTCAARATASWKRVRRDAHGRPRVRLRRCTISHLKIAGRDNWPRAEELVALDRGRARARASRITADQYPYVAGSTLLGAILPPWAHDGGTEATLGAPRRSRAARRACARRWPTPRPTDWDNFWKWSGPEGIVIADVPSGRHPERLGKPPRRTPRAPGARTRSRPPSTCCCEERMGVAMVSFSQDEAVVRALPARCPS